MCSESVEELDGAASAARRKVPLQQVYDYADLNFHVEGCALFVDAEHLDLAAGLALD